jgi:hypothetical protein
LLVIEWFSEVIQCAQLDCFDRVGKRGERSQHDHRNLQLQVVQPPEQPNSIHPLHPVIEDDRRWWALQDVTESDVAVADRLSGKIVAREQTGQRLTHLIVVIGDQDVGFGYSRVLHRTLLIAERLFSFSRFLCSAIGTPSHPGG